MLGGLFKPKWQNKNARVRMQAVSTLAADSAELIQLAEHDPNTGVRLEAIGFLSDFPTLIQLGKRNDSVGERARVRLISLAADTDGEAQDLLLADVFEWLQSTPTLLESIARDPKRHSLLRKLAIPLLDEENLLFRIASEDNAKDIQYLAASQLHNPDNLKKLEKTQGRSNKRLRQLIKERMATQQLEQQRQQHLDALGAELESLGQSSSQSDHWARDKTRYRVLSQSWLKAAEEADISPESEKRFRDAEKEFLRRQENYENQQAELEPLRQIFEQCLDDAENLRDTLQQQPEKLMAATIDQQLEALQERWVSAEDLPDETQQAALNQRWIERYISLTELRDVLSDDLIALSELQRCCSRAETLQTGKRPLQSKQLTGLQADWIRIKRPPQMGQAVAELETRFHQLMDSLNARLLREATERDQQLKAMQAELDQMEADLDQEKYSEAIDIHLKVSQQLKDTRNLPATDKTRIEHRLRAAAPMVMEFKDWRRWGTDQAREHLIETAQRLENDDSLPPEQRAREIKALRQEWRKLAQMEPGQQRKQWKDFDKKVTAAYEPSKQHFAEQAKQRADNLKQREGICIQLETMKTSTDWSQVDWKSQYAGINELRKSWKKCGTVGHKDWKAINQRFNEAMDGLEEHLQAEREHNFKLRQQLTEQAAGLADIDDIQEAVASAKNLQSRWHITIPARPREEQKLWRAFRAPIDAVFKRLKTARSSQRSATQQTIREKEAICVQLESLFDLEGEALKTASRELESIRKAFDTAPSDGLPKNVQQKLESRFNSAEQAIFSKLEQLAQQQKLAALDELAAQSVRTKTANAGTSTAETEKNQLEGERLCLLMEILLDIPTPQDFQQSRMEHQVAQMSEAMRSRHQHIDMQEQGLALLADWYRLGAMPADALDKQQTRINAVRQNISK